MKIPKPVLPNRQRGISLIVTLLIVVLLSLLGLYGAGVLVQDTRSAANDFRAREAAAAAESGTEQGLSFLSANRGRLLAGGLDTDDDGTANTAWTDCTSTAAMCLPIRAGDRTNWKYLTVTGLAAQPDAGSFAVHVLTPKSGDDSLLVYNVVAIGHAADFDATNAPSEAVLKQGAYFYPLLLGNVATPLAAASNVNLTGNYSIITNSNGGGSGVPVSAWSDSSFSPGGSFASCHIGDFTGGACPSSDALSKNGVTGPDMIGNDPNFPDDLFEFLFGVPAAKYQTIKDEAKVVASCGDLSTASGLIWVTGDCNPTGNIGSAANPVLLVVQGDTTLNASSQFYGLLYMFPPPPSTLVPKLKANGAAHLHGAVFAHEGVDLQLTGGFVLEYDSAVLDNLKNSPSSRGLARIPGAWSDVQ